ncbi:MULTISPECIES: hypothetical protein [Achromobacter]|uniref:hypothetical protein n=1 Tax=Achromobacter TaxID=222 RepID=UPI00174A3EF9|nr:MULTISPECIES: hypothetical protein [Achromobacter]
MNVQFHAKSMSQLALGIGSALVCAAMPVSAGAAEASASLKWSTDPSTQCRFVAPESLGDGPKYWTGFCSSVTGVATGVGTIVARTANQAGPAFYGELRAGVPIIGVVSDGAGYRAGLFDGKEIGTSKEAERVDIDDSFKVAERAAKQVSAYYAQQKNTASAKHYQGVAKQFASQLERD